MSITKYLAENVSPEMWFCFALVSMCVGGVLFLFWNGKDKHSVLFVFSQAMVGLGGVFFIVCFVTGVFG